MSVQSEHLVDLRYHSALLADVLGHPHIAMDRRREIIMRDGETLDWMNASSWLHFAASVNDVSVDTAYFDESVMMCGRANDYHNAKSDLFSELASAMTTFGFCWNALESVIKVIDPPRVPRNIKSNARLIDNGIYFLATEYEPRLPVRCYNETAGGLLDLVRQLPYYRTSCAIQFDSFMTMPGYGLHIVRKIRNKFAHGTIELPEPEEWSQSPPRDTELIAESTRVVLLTMQMMLIAFFKNDSFSVECLKEEDGFTREDDVEYVLRCLHLRPQINDPCQLKLFDDPEH